MSILQTIGEVGLEKNALLVWAEPRSGQSLKPKFGVRPFPKKIIYTFLIVISSVFFIGINKGASFPLYFYVFAAITFTFLAWIIVISLDKLSKRNVWVSENFITISHANSRITLPKIKINKIVIYNTKKPTLYALEVVLDRGKSIVVGVPKALPVSDVHAGVMKLGYSVENLSH